MNSGRVFALLWLAALAPAAADTATADDLDPPARVARLSLLEGSVALQPAGSSAWSADVLNWPLSRGDKLMCDSGSRAELQLGSTAIRVGAETALQVVNISDQVVQLGLSSGTLLIRVRSLAPNETVEVDTPNVAVTVLEPGTYRIDVDARSELVAVAVISGYAEVTGQTQDFTLSDRQQGEFSGEETLAVNFGDVTPADDSGAEVLGAARGSESLDDWSAARDARADHSLSSNYVSPEATGYEDLDDNGNWQETPEYGMVWQPQVSVEWVPYQVGRWVWIKPWGWTWIDAAAWGYAPFHYGRWVYVNSAWCWAPGNPRLPQVYAPALVAWLGGPTIAWVALADKEPFQPGYHASAAYLRRLNAGSDALGAGTPGKQRPLANRLIPGAVAAVTPEAFASGGPLNRKLLRLDARHAAGLPALPASALPARMANAGHAPIGMHSATLRSGAALFSHGLVARTGALAALRNPPADGAPSPIKLIPARVVALHAPREFVHPPAVPTAAHTASSSAAAETEHESKNGGNEWSDESRSRPLPQAAAAAGAQNPGTDTHAPKSAPKAPASPKDPRKAKPEPR